MRLTDCHPRWIIPANWCSESLFAIGLTFTCPVCDWPACFYFSPPIDPDGLKAKYQWPDFPPPIGQLQWRRTGGDTFDTLTLEPSLNNDAAGCGHWCLTNGELSNAVSHGPRPKRQRPNRANPALA
jgi:hypothetical protein